MDNIHQTHCSIWGATSRFNSRATSFSYLHWSSNKSTYSHGCSICRWPPAASCHQKSRRFLSPTKGCDWVHPELSNSVNVIYGYIKKKKTHKSWNYVPWGCTPRTSSMLQISWCDPLYSDLSFSQHIESTCSKARKILGLSYQKLYNNVGTLLQLYLSLVRHHLQYASPVWNPYKQKHIKHLENVERFVLHVATKSWHCGSIDGWYHFPIIQKIPDQPVYAIQDHSWLVLFSQNMILTRSNLSYRTNRKLLL